MRVISFALVGLFVLFATLGFGLLPLQRASAQEGAPPPLRSIGVGFARHAFGPWTARIADGSFTQATGRRLRWLPHDTDSAVAAAFASGKLDIAIIGASVAVAAAQRGIDLKVFFVAGSSSLSDGLVMMAHKDSVPGEPKSLQGKVIATPFGSSAHFRLLESCRRWGLSMTAMRLVNLQTQQIEGAWRRGEVDGAAVSSPLLEALMTRGHPVPLPEPAARTSASSGHTGLMLMVASSEFVASHAVFLSRFVDVVARADLAMAQKGLANAEREDAINAVTFITGVAPEAVSASMLRYRPPALAEQSSSRWLGGGPQSGLVAEMDRIADLLRWAGRFSGKDIDFAALLAPEPVQLAATYK